MRKIPKLTAPRAGRIVRRARVSREIAAQLRAKRIAWLAAPAGSGKTTSLLDFLDGKSRPIVWYRADESDRDVASFFHHLALSIGSRSALGRLPTFSVEYTEHLAEFARRFFRAFFARVRQGSFIVFDDLHYAASADFAAAFSIALRELPEDLACICASRELPFSELEDLRVAGRLAVLDQGLLNFTESEARSLVKSRRGKRVADAPDTSAARGWAAGLVLLADRSVEAAARLTQQQPLDAAGQSIVFQTLATQVFEHLDLAERAILMRLSVFSEMTPRLAAAVTREAEDAVDLLAQLHRRQLFIARVDSHELRYRFHDLFREFLRNRMAQQFSVDERMALLARAGELLEQEGQIDEAIELSMEARAYGLAQRQIRTVAARILAAGRRATLISWCERLPPESVAQDSWLCYWRGRANIAQDELAVAWLERAYLGFARDNDIEGQCLSAVTAVLSKTDSWRTHQGLAIWTQRALAFLDSPLRRLDDADRLYVRAGMLRALEFAEDYSVGKPAIRRLCEQLQERLDQRAPSEDVDLRLLASQSLIEFAASDGRRDVFERAVDSVAADLSNPSASPLALGLWLVTFGATSGRYFAYARRGFAYVSAEAALRAAVAIGARESLRGVEFGALYHLQLLMKLQGNLTEFDQIVARLSQIADSRYHTQVAVLADCQAAGHTLRGQYSQAYPCCERFTAAIEAANEPPIERWPHYITAFQVLLGDGKEQEAIASLQRVLAQFEGGTLQRTRICVLLADAWRSRRLGAPDRIERLRSAFHELAPANWTAVLLNLPAILAALCADALAHDIEPQLCRALIRSRGLQPPSDAPMQWPWAIRLHVLGPLRIEIEGELLALGPKSPRKSLDIMRALALSRDHSVAVADLLQWLWPDADGDQAHAACDQALHRLRKLLPSSDALVLREGRLRLDADRVWVDLPSWEASATNALQALRAKAPSARDLAVAAVRAFPAAPLHSEETHSWQISALERVRTLHIDLVVALARNLEASGGLLDALECYRRALEHYECSERLFEGLIRCRLAAGDSLGAVDDFRRCERVLRTVDGRAPTAAVRKLVGHLL